MANEKKIIIKHQNLKKVLQDCHLHITELLDKSTKMLNDKDYPLSIAICIIALEEIGKYEIFGNYQREFKDIPKSTMKKLTMHEYKLTQFLKDEERREIKLLKTSGNKKGIKKIHESVEYQKKQMISLNKVKQLGMYYNFDKGNTITLQSHFMNNKTTKNNLGHFTLVLHELVYYKFDFAVLRNQCGTIDGIIDSNSEQVKQNTNYHHMKKYLDKLETKKYKKSLTKFQNTLLELEALVTYLN